MHDYEFRLIKQFLLTRSALLIITLLAISGFVLLVVREIGIEVNNSILTILGIAIGGAIGLLEKLGTAVSRDVGELIKLLRAGELGEN